MATTTPTAGRSVPELLRAWRAGSATAHGELFARLHQELRALARRRLAQEGAGHTLSPTALVHDAFVRLRGAAPDCADGAQFFALVATVMRRALVDGARRRRARSAALAAAAEQAPGDDAARDDRVLRLDAALERLQRVDPALHRIVELRFLAGLGVDDTATALGVSTATIKRGWRTARAFLQRELDHD